MKLKIALLAGLAAIAFSGNVAARSKPLINPAPIAVPPGMSNETIDNEIVRGLRGRGWSIDSDSQGIIESTLHLREHVARIKVGYDAKAVTIRYVDSTNLDYARDAAGAEQIHDAYNGWIDYLVEDFTRNLAHPNSEKVIGTTVADLATVDTNLEGLPGDTVPGLAIAWDCGDCGQNALIVPLIKQDYANAAAARSLKVSTEKYVTARIVDFRQRPPGVRVMFGVMSGKDRLRLEIKHGDQVITVGDTAATAIHGQNSLCENVAKEALEKMVALKK